jgi:hypothetical protein
MWHQMSPFVLCSAGTNKMSLQKTCKGCNLAITLRLLFTFMQQQKNIAYSLYCLSMVDNDSVLSRQSQQKEKIRVKIIKRKE